MSTGIQFNRPIGPNADTRELEYIAALQQTCKGELREDATVTVQDICSFLNSRHGIKIDENIVQEQIVEELCGALSHKDSIDLCQMVALLIIPFLRRQQNKKHNQLDLVQKVFALIADEAMSFKVYREFHGGVALTPKLLREVFESYGEYNIPEEILEEMVIAAGGDNLGVVFTPHRFERGLTHDIGIYDINTEMELTTHYDDGSKAVKTPRKADPYVDSEAGDASKKKQQQQQRKSLNDALEERRLDSMGKLLVKQNYTAPNIDYAAETFRSPLWVTLLWICVMTVYLSYVWHTSFRITIPCGTVVEENDSEETINDNNNYGCTVALAVVTWLAMLLKMVLLGVTFVFLGSFGNCTTMLVTFGDKMKATFRIFLAFTVVFFATIYTFMSHTVATSFINTSKNEYFGTGYYVSLIAGSVIIFIQFMRLISIWYPQLLQTVIGRLFAGGTQLIEMRTKLAATCKINVMMENAIIMHHVAMASSDVAVVKKWDPSIFLEPTSPKLFEKVVSLNRQRMQDDNGDENASEVAFVNFQAVQYTTVPSGGVLWTWFRMFNNKIYTEEGVWLHSRLLASNMTQFLVSIFLVVVVSIYLRQAFLYLYPPFDDDNPINDVASDYASKTIPASQFLYGDNEELSWNILEYVEENIFYLSLHEIQDFVSLTNNTSLDDIVETGVETLSYMIDVNNTSVFLNVTGANLFLNSTLGAIYIAAILEDDQNNNTTDASNNNTNSSNSSSSSSSIETEFTQGAFFHNDTTTTTNSSSFYFDERHFYPENGILESFGFEGLWWEIRATIWSGLIAGLLASFGISFVYIPSFTSIVLKFRTGVLQSLRDPEFLRYRTSQDSAAVLFGCAFWGVWFSTILSVVLVMILVFLLISSNLLFVCLFVSSPIPTPTQSQLTRDYVVQFSAHLLGAVITILINTIILILLRNEVYTPAFYRKRPAAANFLTLALECWNIALTVAFMLARTVKLLVVVMFYVGRVDTPVLAPGIGTVLGSPLDSIPTAFKKDILIHEAHHHPYIERLGLMYLMKLRNGINFGSRAGSYWRLLFVLALMPWMRTYRDHNNITNSDNDDDYFSDEDIQKKGSNHSSSENKKYKKEIHLELDMLRKENKRLRQEIKKLRRRRR